MEINCLEPYKERIKALTQDVINYQSRIQKAISLIDTHTTDFGDLILQKQLVKMLIDILEGDDK